MLNRDCFGVTCPRLRSAGHLLHLTAAVLLFALSASIAHGQGAQPPQRFVTCGGKVASVGEIDPIVVVLDTGKANVTVELAPKNVLDQLKTKVKLGDQISVKGYEPKDSRRVIAVELTTSDTHTITLRYDDLEPVWTKSWTPYSVKGTFKSLAGIDPSFAIIKTDKGEVTAELGPSYFLIEHKLRLIPNEEVTIKGYDADREGRKTLVAIEVLTKDKSLQLRGAYVLPLWPRAVTALLSATERIKSDIERKECRAKFPRSVSLEKIKEVVVKRVACAKFETIPPTWDDYNQLVTLFRDSKGQVASNCDRYESVRLAIRIDSTQEKCWCLFAEADGSMRRRLSEPEGEAIGIDDLIRSVVAPLVKAIEQDVDAKCPESR